MICKYCNSEIYDNVKFCPECGKKIDIESVYSQSEEKSVTLDDYVQETSDEVEEVKLSDDSYSEAERKIWYYIAGGETLGGYTEAEMLELVKNGTVTKNTYVWREGDADWRFASNSLLGSFFETPVQESTVHEEKKSTSQEKQWYYADGANNQHGPYTESEMIQFIRDGKIHSDNYVWKPGLSEWVFLSASSLSGYVSQAGRNVQTQRTTQRTNRQNSNYRNVPGLTNRNIALAIVFSFISCGIYSIYWLYAIVRDANNIAKSQGKEPVFDAGLAVLLHFVTCGLFSIYLFYKLGKVLGTCSNKYGNNMEDTSIVQMILCIFGLSIVSMCIAQSQINECA